MLFSLLRRLLAVVLLLATVLLRLDADLSLDTLFCCCCLFWFRFVLLLFVSACCCCCCCCSPVPISIESSSSEGVAPPCSSRSACSSPSSSSSSSTRSSPSSTGSSSSTMASSATARRRWCPASSSSVWLLTILNWPPSSSPEPAPSPIFTSIMSIELLSYSSAPVNPSPSPPVSLPESFRGRPRLRFCCERAEPRSGFVWSIVLLPLLLFWCSRLLLWLRPAALLAVAPPPADGDEDEDEDGGPLGLSSFTSECGQPVLIDGHLAAVHKVQQALHVFVRDVAQDHDRVPLRVVHEQLLEVQLHAETKCETRSRGMMMIDRARRAKGFTTMIRSPSPPTTYLVRLQVLPFDGQRHVDERFIVQQLVEHGEQEMSLPG
uniref:Uncharacterized protein n=1 Tax=Anopheles atroparvus TaxID=41427 RepID=A0A182JEY9_ANOAO